MRTFLLAVGIAVSALVAVFLLQLESASSNGSIAPPGEESRVDADTPPELASAATVHADARMLAAEPASIAPDPEAIAPASYDL